MNGRFVLTASGDRFLFNLKAGNSEIILTSERYTAKASALNAIEAVRESARFDDGFLRRTSSGGQPYFVLCAANRQVLGTSELYWSTAARDQGIASLQRIAPTALVDDQTRSGQAVSNG